MNDQFNKDKEALFVDVTAFKGLGETISTYLAKGRKVLLEGRLNLDRWEDTEGKKRNKLNIIAQNVQFLGSANGNNNHGDSTPEETTAAISTMGDEDIPF